VKCPNNLSATREATLFARSWPMKLTVSTIFRRKHHVKNE
jgi:hypothetical protein